MHGTYGNFGNNVNSNVHQGLAECNGKNDFSIKQSEPSLASGIDRLRETGKQAHDVHERLLQLVERFRPGPVSGLGHTLSENEPIGTIGEFHSGLDALSYALSDITALVRRLEQIHG